VNNYRSISGNRRSYIYRVVGRVCPMCFILFDPLSIVRMRRDSIAYSIRPSRHNCFTAAMSARRTTIEGRHVNVFQKVPRKSDDDRFPMLERRLLASRSCLSGYLRLVAWSTIDCIWTGKVVLHMSRVSTSFIRLTLEIDAVAFMKTFDSRSDGQSSSDVDLLLLSYCIRLYN
jgi:hypothetical protein